MKLPRKRPSSDDPDVSYAVGCLDQALANILEAREALGDFEAEPPHLALDLALQGDPAHRRCRDRLVERLHTLREVVPAHLVTDVLACLEAMDEMASSAASVGYAVGIIVTSGVRQGWDA